jgi:hypothetical protein
MKQSTVEFVNKMIEAKKMEQEAIMGLFPDQMQKHLKTINNELKAMFIESALDIAVSMYQNGSYKRDKNSDIDNMCETGDHDHQRTSSHVHKVEIG